MNGIKKDTFKEMKSDDKLNVLFDMSMEGNQRLEKLEKSRLWNPVLTFGGALIGGVLVMISKSLF